MIVWSAEFGIVGDEVARAADPIRGFLRSGLDGLGDRYGRA